MPTSPLLRFFFVALIGSACSLSPRPGQQARSQTPPALDVQAHRGGRGLRPENTLPAFEHSLRLGVTTLELDTGVSKDGVVVVSHERRVSALQCRDTQPVVPGDPAYPYVGKLLRELTLAQIKTLDCGTRHPSDPRADPFLPTLTQLPGTPMPTLAEVFELTRRLGADGVRFNVETKLDPTIPEEALDAAPFAEAVLAVCERYGVLDRLTVQSFDWRVLAIVKERAPTVVRAALVWGPTAELGRPGASPWLAGIDADAAPYDGDLAAAAAAAGAQVLSPDYALVSDRMVASAHRQGLAILPWTVNEKAAMDSLIALGVDGIITDYPDRLREVLAARGLPLPKPVPVAGE